MVGGRDSLPQMPLPMPPLLALGRIIYFSNSGGWRLGAPSLCQLAQAARKRTEERRAPGAQEAWAGCVPGPGPQGPEGAMLAVSLKWRLGVVRRRPKGTDGGAGHGAALLPAQGLGCWT